MQATNTKKDLRDYLKPGVDPDHIPGLSAILRVKSTIDVFMAVFRGTNEDVIIRLMLLREMGERCDNPNWSSSELKAYFTFLEQSKFESALSRLKEFGLLSQQEDTGDVNVSAIGHMILSSLATILQSSDAADGSEIGFLLGQVAANEMIGNISAEQLQHLLSRLNELLEQFDRDILSGSEHRIRDAEKRLSTVWQWLEKGTEMIKAIASSENIDPVAHKVAQKIGQVQSRILRLTSVFQRILNQFESQKVHLGQSGLSTSDVSQWLRTKSIKDLVAVAENSVSICPQPAFVVTDIMMDIAEYELLEREHPMDEGASALPDAQVAAMSEHDDAPPENVQLKDWLVQLQDVKDAVDLSNYIPNNSFEEAAYRLSLLALLQDKSASKIPGLAAELAKLPLEVDILPTHTRIDRAGIGLISDGKITKR